MQEDVIPHVSLHALHISVCVYYRLFFRLVVGFWRQVCVSRA